MTIIQHKSKIKFTPVTIFKCKRDLSEDTLLMRLYIHFVLTFSHLNLMCEIYNKQLRTQDLQSHKTLSIFYYGLVILIKYYPIMQAFCLYVQP
jgi:hypothetical protein